MIKGIQLLGIGVSVFLIIQTLIQYRRGVYGFWRTMFWAGLWALIGFLFAFPSITTFALPVLSLQSAMFATQVVAIIVIFLILHHTYQQLAKIEKKLTRLVQNLAINDYLTNLPKGNPGGRREEE